MWIDNPKVQLVMEDVLNKFDPQTVKSLLFQILLQFVTLIEWNFFKDEKVLIIRIYKYLERYSYINFGVFKRIIPLTSKFELKNLNQIIKQILLFLKINL